MVELNIYLYLSIPMDYLAHLIVSLPPVVIFLISIPITVLLWIGFYFLEAFLCSSPAFNFLFFDLDEMMSHLRQPKPPKPRGRLSHSHRNDSKNRYLQNDLLILLKGDVATAKRLLAQQRRKNPGRSDNWYLEKVIYDLERDRRH
jgi:hypothetical protein